MEKVKFEFDERSLISLSKLREQGFEFDEIRVGDRVLLIPKEGFKLQLAVG